MMVGLPGSGKSSVVENLVKLVPCVMVSTDSVRLRMREQPTYTPAEMMLVYEVCYAIIESRLRHGQRVIFDASNYLAARRQHLYNIAKRCSSPIAVCYVQASQATIRQRLIERMSEKRRKTDLSDADWSVYKWMVEAQEPVTSQHLVLDTTSTSPDELAQRLRRYWAECETSVTSSFDFQSAGWIDRFGNSNLTGR